MKCKKELGNIAALSVFIWHLPSLCKATHLSSTIARPILGEHIRHLRQSLGDIVSDSGTIYDYRQYYNRYPATCNRITQILQVSGMTVPECFRPTGQDNGNMTIGEELRLYVPVLLGYHNAIVHLWTEESERHSNSSLLESIFHTACDLYHVIDDIKVLISLFGLEPSNTSSCNILFNNVTGANRVRRNEHLLCLTEDYVSHLDSRIGTMFYEGRQ